MNRTFIWIIAAITLMATMFGGWYQYKNVHRMELYQACHSDPQCLQSVAQKLGEAQFGAYNVSGGGTYRLQSSIGSTDTSITLTSFKEPISNIKYTMTYLNSSIEYGTVDPLNNNVKEFISFTGITQNSDGTATLTGVTRGLAFSYPFTASTTLQQPHSGQAIFILSNAPQVLNQFANLNNTNTISGVWTFNSTSPPQYDSNYNASGLQFVDFNQLNAVSVTGAATTTYTGMGIAQLATSVQIASSTASSSLNQAFGGAPLVVEAQYGTTTPGRLCNSGIWNCFPVAQVSGKIAQSWLDLTAAFTWTGTHIFNGAVQIAATVANPFTLNGLAYNFPGARAASSTVLSEDGSGNLSFETPTYGTLLLSTTTSQAMAYATTSSFSAYSHLHVVIYEPQTAGNVCLNFNSDGGANYGSVIAGGAGSTIAYLKSQYPTTPQDAIINMDINNPLSKRKLATYIETASDASTNIPLATSSSILWNNTSAQITQITIIGNTARCDSQNVPSGTIINVYGDN